MGFSHSSAGKESTCSVGDPGSIPGLGRSTEEGIGYPLQYSWTSCVAQLVKNSLQGGGFRMRNVCTPMAESHQCMAKTTTIL